MSTYNQGSPPSISELKEEVKNWSYYDKNDDFLLRFGKIKRSDNKKIIKFEALYTKIISRERIMYANNFEEEDLKEDLEILENLDLDTYLNVLFEFKDQNFNYENNQGEIEFMIFNKKKGENNFKKMTRVLKRTKCKDEKFFNENIKKKIKQLKNLLDNKYSKFLEENEKLKNENKRLAEELKNIENKNKNLEEKIENISKSLKSVEDIQTKAIKCLTNFY